MIKRTSAGLRVNEISKLIFYAGAHDYVGAGDSWVHLKKKGKKRKLEKSNKKGKIARAEHSSQTHTVVHWLLRDVFHIVLLS